ncbi:MAG: GNAT family N-acetyltransferase [Stappiaceae bacterium]
MNAADYTLEQLRAWAPDHIPVSGFERRIAQTEVFVTEDGSGITGIGSLTGGDYLDLLFVRHDRQRRGLGRLLIAAIEHSARSAGGVSALTSDVSITAKPLFIASGFNIITEQMVELRGQTLKNFKMLKNLA